MKNLINKILNGGGGVSESYNTINKIKNKIILKGG